MAEKRFKSIIVYDGLFIYKDEINSPFYQLRLRIPELKKYKVVSTGTKNLIEAKEFAKDYYLKFNQNGSLDKTPAQLTFKYWAKKYLKSIELTKGSDNTGYKIDVNRLLGEKIGMCNTIGHVDINSLNNAHIVEYFNSKEIYAKLSEAQSLENNTKNKYISLIKSVLRLAIQENAINKLPDLISYKRVKKDNPRPSFGFEGDNSEYRQLLDGIRECVEAGDVVRYQKITRELYDVVMFLVHGFMRPTVSEIFALKFGDIKIISQGKTKALQIRIKKGKTGFRTSNSTADLIGIFNKIKKENPDYKAEDYLFMPNYANRTTVIKIFQKQFNYVLKKYNLEFDDYGQKRSLYSCRHLAIQMRLVKSGGKINILWFAKNCGTSVEMLERFYAKYLPNSFEVIRNLQSFAD